MPIYGAVPRAAYRQQPRGNPRSLGFERYALGFNGIDNLVDCGIDIFTEADFVNGISLEVLVYILSLDAVTQALIGMEDRPTLYISGGDDLVKFFNYDGAIHTAIGDGAVVTDTWYHIIGTQGAGVAGVMTLFINKVAQAITDISGVGTIDAVNRPTTLGRAAASASSYLHSYIALARIYNRALAADEVRWNKLNYHNPIRNGLVLWLPMEEGAGLIVYDKSGFGNNGSLLPALTPPTWERVRQWELRAETE